MEASSSDEGQRERSASNRGGRQRHVQPVLWVTAALLDETFEASIQAEAADQPRQSAELDVSSLLLQELDWSACPSLCLGNSYWFPFQRTQPSHRPKQRLKRTPGDRGLRPQVMGTGPADVWAGRAQQTELGGRDAGKVLLGRTLLRGCGACLWVYS